MPSIVSVNVGRPRAATWAGIGRTSIDKRAVHGPVLARRLGLEDDRVSDTRHHGGPDQAVYAFAREDLDRWAEVLGQEVPDGQFGENLTTGGLDVSEAEIGERWLVGDAVLEVAAVRIPCNDFKTWMGRCGYDDRAWVRRFTEVGAPGAYLRVLAEGELRAGDELTVVHQPGHGVTVRTMFRAWTTDRSLLPELLQVEGLAAKSRARAEEYVAAQDEQKATRQTATGA